MHLHIWVLYLHILLYLWVFRPVNVILASQAAERSAKGANLTENKFKNGPEKTHRYGTLTI
jgi:hypothetical protein